VGLIIFDFDGVVADSEFLANQLLAEGLSKIGLATTTEESLRFYMGLRFVDCAAAMEQRLGRALPEGFLESQVAMIHARLVAEVEPVCGVLEFLQSYAGVARCIASSSSVDYIGLCLDRMAMTHLFEHRFSGQDVERGKPHPDLFLKAAATLGVPAADCVVIEDSPTGVKAGKAADMVTIGLCAGRHALAGHAQRLAEVGADIVVSSYGEAAQFLGGP
jgi:HAD superfamily hydrolase (TIGR01509 family)